MKPIAFFALLIFSFHGLSQTAISWSTPIEVNGTTDAHRPRIDLLQDNTPVLIWSKFSGSSNKDYFFSRWNTTDFLAPVILSDANILSYDWGGSDIIADGNTLYTVYKSANVTDGRVYIRRSLDGGLTWESKIQIEESGELAMYPSVEAYGGNKVLVTYMTHGPGGTNPQYIVRESSDGGQTFSSGASVSADFGEEACYCCPPAIVGNQDYQVMSFRNDESNIRDMKAGVSTNGGITFDTQISLDDHIWTISSCPATGGDLVLNGSQLYTTYMSKGGGDEMIYFAEDDLSNTAPYTVSQAVELGTISNMNHPHLSNFGDTVVLVWQQTDQTETDVWFNFSTDGMNNWQTSTAAPAFELSGIQSKPDIAIGTDGSVHLVYLDAELDRVMYSKGTFGFAELNENDLATFEIHPNPASDILVLNGIGSNEFYSIINSQGAVIQQGSGLEVDVQQLTSGLYFVEISGYKRQKFVVK